MATFLTPERLQTRGSWWVNKKCWFVGADSSSDTAVTVLDDDDHRHRRPMEGCLWRESKQLCQSPDKTVKDADLAGKGFVVVVVVAAAVVVIE
jgi:hypothetical protein